MQDISLKTTDSSVQEDNNSDDQLFYIEEFTDDLIKRFNATVLTGYFRDVYADQLLRMHTNSSSKTGGPTNVLDKVTLMEFINLPGILADRFYALVGNGSKTDARIVQDKFIPVMQTIYNSPLEEKMRLTFEMFDFDCDGKISADDVRLVLSYIPFVRRENSSLTVSDSSQERDDLGKSKLNARSIQEGLYCSSEGKDMNESQRIQNQKKIRNFTDAVFANKSVMTLKEYIQFNTSVSPEMFISIITVLQERIPCSQYVFKQMRAFKQAEFLKNQKLLINSPQKSQLSDEESIAAKAEEMCMSPLKALPNPKMLQMLQPQQSTSLFKPDTPTTASNSSGHNAKKSSLQSEFKIKKKVGAYNDSTRQAALSNSRLSEASSELVDSVDGGEGERADSISRLIENSKMRRMQEARRNWA